MDKLKAIFDVDTFKIVCAGIVPWLTFEHMDVLFKIIASAGAAFYIWRKIYRNKD